MDVPKKKLSPKEPKKPKDYTLRDLANIAEALGMTCEIQLVPIRYKVVEPRRPWWRRLLRKERRET